MTELQQKLSQIAESIGRIGFYVAILTFMVTVIFIILRTYQQKDRSFDIEFLQDVCHGLILALTIVFVATPQGLPLALTISTAYSVRKMYEKNNLVLRLESFEAMGQITEICTDMSHALVNSDSQLKPGIKDAISQCEQAGINVIMISRGQDE